jgi:hypothetical protein
MFDSPPPEINGHMDINSLTPENQRKYSIILMNLTTKFEAEKNKYPEWKIPVVKLRYASKFMANEDIGRKLKVTPNCPIIITKSRRSSFLHSWTHLLIRDRIGLRKLRGVIFRGGGLMRSGRRRI